MSKKNTAENAKYVYACCLPADSGIVLPHLQELNRRGYNVVSNILGSKKPRKEIPAAAAVIAFFTLGAPMSERRQQEKDLKLAVKAKLPVIPVFIGFNEMKLPDVLKKHSIICEPIDGSEIPYVSVTDMENQLRDICPPARPSEFYDDRITPEEELLPADELYKRGCDAEAAWNAAKAVRYYTLAAEKGHVEARRDLGYCYEYGRGVAMDHKKALECYHTAAEQGEASCYMDIGNCYQAGKGVPVDLKKALEYYIKSAELGYGRAQNNVGNCYLLGTGVRVDEQKAMHYYLMAADQDVPEAMYVVGVVYEHGRYGYPKDEKKAFEYYQKCAEQGYEKAYYKMGLCYFEGTGTEVNESLAAKYFELSARCGDSYSQYNYGFCLYRGRGVPENRELGIHYIAMAAKQGHPKALEDLKKMGRTDLLKN